MACSSLTSLPRACGEGVVGGLEKLYMIAFQDLAPVSGSTEVYSVSTDGIVNEVGLQSGKTFVEVGLLKSTAGLKEALTKNNQTGTSFLTQTFTLVLSNITTTNRTWVESVMDQPVAVLVKSRTGKFFVAGLNGQFELSALESGTGTAEGDLMGYSLTFSGIDTKLVPQVDDTIITDIIASE